MSMLIRSLRAVLGPASRAFFRLRVEGLENLPAAGPAIMAGNHASLLDGLVLMLASRRPVHFLVTDEFYFHPIVHPFAKAMQCIPVYRNKAHNPDALAAAKQALAEGKVIGIFPEGTILEGGRMEHPRRGVAVLARHSGATLIPFGIAGSAEAMAPFRKIPQPRPVSLAIGEGWQEAPEGDMQETLERVRVRVLSEKARADRLRQALPHRSLPGRVACGLAGLLVVPLAAAITLTTR
ncbi:MAG: lysophospholipid acyltransferase family protein [Candidatus Xenobia bacterium]